jgi:hypothetical protein
MSTTRKDRLTIQIDHKYKEALRALAFQLKTSISKVAGVIIEKELHEQ